MSGMLRRPPPSSRLPALALALSLPACQAVIEAPGGGPGAGVGGAAPSEPPATAGAGAAGDQAGPASFTHSSGLRRLTRVEYQNTARSLVGAGVACEAQPKETIIEGHGQIAAAQKTGYEDVDAYYGLGEVIANQVGDALTQSLSCSDAACFKVWASGFLAQAFRAPLESATEERYLSIFDDEEAGATLEERLRTFVTSVLSSPYFLYRREIGEGAGAERQLNPHEIAARLSYLVWQDTPDATILERASAGGLKEATERGDELDRMLQDPRAERGLRGFALDWLGLFENALVKKDAALLAESVAELPALAERSFELTVWDTLGAADARFTDLFRLDQFYADDAIAALLGVDTAGSEMQKVPFPISQRQGILTHPLVIGAHSKESGASPFPIGQFIFENVLCKEIPPPIPGIPTVEAGSSAQTLREKLEELTQGQPCATCHTQIGPPGFAFLPFDPIGRYSAADGQGRPYDTAGELVLPSVEQPVPFADVSELSRILGEQPDVARCVAKRLFRFGYGRFEGAGDEGELAALEGDAVATNAGVRALLTQLVTSPSFAKVRVKP